MLTHLSLFSGIAGFDLAAEWAGFETICFVEINKFRQRVLRKHWPDVPIIEDVRDVTREKVMAYARCKHDEGELLQREHEETTSERSTTSSERPNSLSRISIQPITTRDISPVTLITGGFPCQPVSVAGKRKGKADDRWLWPEMFRVVQEIRPTWVVGENVAGIIRMELDNCISDLEGIGYSCQAFVIPACAVNAPHRRDRVFIVAYSNSSRDPQSGIQRTSLSSEPSQAVAYTNTSKATRQRGYSRQGLRQPESNELTTSSQDVADTSKQGLEIGSEPTDGRRIIWEEGETPSQGSWWAVEPDVGRVAHGVPSRVDRLAALGDAVVPQQVYPILKAIAEIELNVVQDSR